MWIYYQHGNTLDQDSHQLLERIIAGSIDPEEEQTYPGFTALITALRSLIGQNVPLPSGDTITVGDVSNSKGIAVGAHSIAIADLVIHIHQQPRPTPSPIFTAPEPPPHFVPRPHEFDQLLGYLLQADQSAPVALTASLTGAGGFGKTTLAQALCADARVKAAFPDGIL